MSAPREPSALARLAGPFTRTRAGQAVGRALRQAWANQLSGPTDPARDAGWEPTPRKGFFTDTSICIGCKACEVACKEWNQVPARPAENNTPQLRESSYDNSAHLGANTWRHVAFIEQDALRVRLAREEGAAMAADDRAAGHEATVPQVTGEIDARASTARGSTPLPVPAVRPGLVSGANDVPGRATVPSAGDAHTDVPPVRWLMSSDVCKHCTHAACLDVCPTGALFRTEFGTVVVQDDVCNGCGYCVAACPFGVIGRRESGTVTVESADGSQAPGPTNVGVAQKCTLCYDRIGAGLTPACAQTCPTTSITFGNHADMVAMARARLAQLHAEGQTEARLYGANPDDGVGGTGSVFLLMDAPEVYGLPPEPRVTTADLPDMFTHAGVAGTAMIGGVLAAFLAERAAGALRGGG